MGKNNKNKHEINIKIEGNQWKEALNKAYVKNNKKANIKGFRPGKAPYDVFVKQYGVESLFLDASDLVIQDAYTKALAESKLIPVVKPSVDIKDVSEESIEFTFIVTTRPEVNIKKYKDLKVKKDSTSVTDEEINHEIEHLKEHYTELVIKDGVLENGDTAIIDYEGFVDGVAFEGGKAENYSLEIGSNTFIPGFEESLIGMEKETEKDIEVTFPSDYHAENLKGKKAIFKVKLHEIKTKEERELNEEFFEDLGLDGVNSEETLKEHIKEHLEAHKKTDVENKFVDELLDQISKNTEVDIPEEMVEEEIDMLVERMAENLKYQGATLELYYELTKTTEADLRNNLEKEAFKNVLYRLILEEIIKLENIDITDEEVDKEIEKIVKEYKVTSEEVIKEYGSKDIFKYNLKMNKVFEKLTEYNEVK